MSTSDFLKAMSREELIRFSDSIPSAALEYDRRYQAAPSTEPVKKENPAQVKQQQSDPTKVFSVKHDPKALEDSDNYRSDGTPISKPYLKVR